LWQVPAGISDEEMATSGELNVCKSGCDFADSAD
jgi:hypothetical protein